MSNPVENDGISRALLERTLALKKLIEADDFGMRRELDANSEMLNHLLDLENIHRSLDQYTRSERDMRYIGLVGHYSAGKSSTINQLLSERNRDVDLNPTDKGVTYLTHKDNGRKVLSAASTGKLEVKVSLIDNELLKDCVLLDSPGTGDPSKVGAMVSDILPLASLILYVVSAANPFDESDVPTMKTVSSELDHIPIKFLITRSDEFRIDPKKPLSQENFDEQKKNEFAATFVARVRKEGMVDNLSTDDLIFIDNISGFGIEELKEFAIHGDLNTSMIHMNTLHFYIRKATSIWKKFFSWGQQVDTVMTGLVEMASKNRAKFDENAGMSSEKLSKFWTSNHQVVCPVMVVQP